MPRRTSSLTHAVLASVLVVAAFQLVVPSAFVGLRSPPRQDPLTQRQGWRFDKMLQQTDGTMNLQTSEGFFIGETAWIKIQNAKGLRYRMRPTFKEYKEGIEVDNLLWQIGPFKVKLGEWFGGTGNNPARRELKRQIVAEGLTDPQKIEENKYWLARYGHKRWSAYSVDQSTGLEYKKGFWRGLAAWSGYDPLCEERGSKWEEADYGKPQLAKYVGVRRKGWVTPEQVKKEYSSGKLK